MRPVLGILAGAALAAVGAVILGEYDLAGTTAVIGFPLYALAVTEVSAAAGGRLGRAMVAVPVVVGLGLTWALWISFNHFRREDPPVLSWVMVVVSMAVAVAWGVSSRRAATGRPPVANDS